MVHHTEWDRKIDERGGYMQKDHDEMEEIIREMSPGGKHYHAFTDGSVKTDAQIVKTGATSEVVHRGAPYDHSLPSFYHGSWYQNSNYFFKGFLEVMSLVLIVFMLVKLMGMSSKMLPFPKRTASSARYRSRSRK